MSKSIIKLSTLLAANTAVNNMEIAEKALAGLKTDYCKKSFAAGFSFYASSSGIPTIIPRGVIVAALESMIVTAKGDLKKLGVEIDA